MKTNFYLENKKVSRAKLNGLLGKERVERYVEEAKETFREDPYIQNSWYLGIGRLTIEFV